MRSNRPYSPREHFSAVRKYLVTKLSLVFIRAFGVRKVILVRDGGLGDAIMATSVVLLLKQKYPKTKFFISACFPEIFEGYELKKDSFLSFPVIWLSYTHYDFFPWSFRKSIHCGHIMAELVGVKKEWKNVCPLSIDESRAEHFMSEHVIGKKYVVIQPHAGEWFKEKNWIHEKWVKLVKELNDHGTHVYQIGTSENPFIDGCIDFRGKASIEESLLLLKHSTLMIGVNSFAEQAALAFNTPSVILYGPTNPQYSLNSGQIAVYSNQVLQYQDLSNLSYQFHAMDSIEVKTVLNEVLNILEQVN